MCVSMCPPVCMYFSDTTNDDDFLHQININNLNTFTFN